MSIIEVQNLGKRYRIHHQAKSRTNNQTFREFLIDNTKNLLKKSPSKTKATSEDFWALKDVSFTVPRGEVLGIIGKNGAGKSTLLKLLSRITEPTTGNFKLYGRIASLLEVGTGFHPELTGRENIFLNGSILGMSRKEIKSKLASIVEFAEVEKFLDTPVKRYSSGMYVRLAFSIAAHLDPEILLVDEVLAVGDVHFQKKCLGKIDDIARSGRTVIFVSHNMNTIRKLCTHCLYIDGGKLIDQGDCDTIIERYLSEQSIETECSVDLENAPRVSQREGARFKSIHLTNQHNEPCHIFSMDESMCITVVAHYSINNQGYIHSFTISDHMGQAIHYFRDRDDPQLHTPQATQLSMSVTIEKLKLYPGQYFISVWLGDTGAKPIDWIHNCISFEVTQGAHHTLWPITRNNGCVHEDGEWQFKKLN